MGTRKASRRRCAHGAKTADREYEITGEVLSMIPLRNRRATPEGEQLHTRITEAMTPLRVRRAESASA